MNKIFKIFFIIFFLNIFNLSISFSLIKNNIIAKVGNEIITLIELENKINTTLILTNQEINQENINKIKTLTLKRLIDLKIKQNEVKKYKVTVDESAIKNHMQRISEKLNLEPKNLKIFFQSNMISYDQYKEEIETEFLWQRLIAEIYSSKVNISKDQIEKEINTFINEKEKIIEFKLAEIEVSYDNKTKNKLINEIKDSIKNIGFSKTVLKYSISTSALDEGEIGWVNSKAISINLINEIKKLKIGEVSREILGSETLVFYKMLDKRVSEASNQIDIDRIRKNIIAKKKNELLNLYSNSHLSKKKNNTLIKLQ
jgi:peptidyl-prolyl cis-trans isomerase SurA